MTKKQKLPTQTIHVTKPTKKLRGLAAVPIKRRKEIAAIGGKMAHVKGKAHEFTSEEAKKAGSLGGKKTAERNRKR